MRGVAAPLSFRAARGVGQALHLRIAAQLVKAVANRLGRHRLQPQALYRLAGFTVLRDVIEDQLAFAPRVTGIDQAIDILAFDQLVEHLESRFRLCDRRQRKMRGNDRQMGERPFAALDLEFFRAG